jgi:uncharacterized membrane protein YtjA (UPF0391 family)
LQTRIAADAIRRAAGSESLGMVRASRGPQEDTTMLQWALTFFVLAIIAGLVGLTGIAGAAANVAWILFVAFLVLMIVAAVANAVRGRPPV